MEKLENTLKQGKEEVFPSVLLVGCGKMGASLMQGWQKEKYFSCVVVDRHKPLVPESYQLRESCQCVCSVSDIPQEFVPDVIVLAIKPQKAEEVLIVLGERYAHQNPTLLSVMAGRTIAFLEKTWCTRSNNCPPIIRAMPNTPSVLGAGVCGLYASPKATAEKKQYCDTLMRAVGKTVWVDEEHLIDAVTGVSGSGPAYVFLLAEWLEKAGQEQGLPLSVARLLAREVIYGAGKMLHELPTEASELRQNVTSPGGTTAAALSVLMGAEAFPKIVPEAVAAAVHRAGELAG